MTNKNITFMKKIFTLIAMLVMTLTASAAFQITEAKGWQESLYAKFSLYDGAETYNVYVKGGQYADYTQIDKQLVRDYGTYGRADVVGLKAGNYSIKVVPVVGGAEVTASAAEKTGLTVKNYTREGFAFMNSYSPGAYKSDGTLKANAKVFYVTKNTAKTISMNVSGAETNPCVGLQAIITGYEKGQETTPVAFRFIGLVEVDDIDAVGSKEEGIQIKGKKADSELNMTFEGIGDDATIRGFGFLLRNTKGVEFRNFGIMRCMDDGISMDTDNSNIWVHNMDIFYGKHGSGDHAKGDGALDVKSDSKYVTVSYNRFWDTGKSNMFGMKSESGPNYISYDHNWFDHSDSRHPRVRTMSVHVWNNYFDNVAKYGVGATTSASVFVESNYFLKTKKPILSSQQGTDGLGDGTFSGENGGIIKAYGNYFDKTATNFSYYTQNNPASTGYDAYEVTSRDAQVPSSETARVGGGTYNNFDTNSSLMYTYNPVAAADVPALVMGEYGAGRLNHGDFTYSFPDNVGNDNTDSAYDATLGSKLDDYKSSFVKIFGDADSGEGGGGEGGGDDPTPTPTDDATFCHFTGNTPSSTQVTVTGNYSNSKGSVTYAGTSYNICVKMEGTTVVSVTPTYSGNVTLIFDTANKGVKVDNVKYTTNSNGKYTFAATAGQTYQVTKGDSMNLFIIELPSASSSVTTISAEDGEFKTVKFVKNGQILISKNGKLYTAAGAQMK